jgi:hypothetical protein
MESFSYLTNLGKDFPWVSRQLWFDSLLFFILFLGQGFDKLSWERLFYFEKKIVDKFKQLNM